MTKSALIFGYGFIGAAFADDARHAGYHVYATARSPEKRRVLGELGLTPVDPSDPKALAEAVQQVEALLITAAPTHEGCPAFAALAGLQNTAQQVYAEVHH